MGGLRLELAEAVPPHTVLNVRPAEATEIIPWVALEVRNCHQGQDGWEVGCQFVQTPPSSILWLFG
jgi:hypothetical protein